MDLVNAGSSVYHRFACIYERTLDRRLVSATGPLADGLRRVWASVALSGEPGALNLDETLIERQDHSDDYFDHFDHFDGNRTEPVRVCALEQCAGSGVRGICLSATDNRPITPFDSRFALTLLSNVHLPAPGRSPVISPTSGPSSRSPLPEELANLFSAFLRNTTAADAWPAHGHALFAQRASFFVDRRLPLEFVLPAFPCKSSNSDKVASRRPDAGEEMALGRLHEFVARVGQVYPPGARVMIVSDGHVFSDCVGVDDDEVDEYAHALHQLNARVAANFSCKDGVSFLSLIDLFGLYCPHQQQFFASLDLPVPPHFVPTKISPRAELSRQILLRGCEPDRQVARHTILGQGRTTTTTKTTTTTTTAAAPQGSILGLYRGFSRFMLEDLQAHPAVRGVLSRSAQRKLSSKIAFEMMIRNQAYSNLVEMLFPRHIRLSIHAHNNSGPKFGVRLFDPTTTSGSFDRGPVDLLHIPTPWHNCVVRVRPSLSSTVVVSYVVRKKVVEEALRRGTLVGGWSAADGCYDVRCCASPVVQGTGEQAYQVVLTGASQRAIRQTEAVAVQ